jgi:arylsulfatase A-like enzyme
MDVHNYYQPAEVVSARAREWLGSADGKRPFFLFVHFMDPHDPYFVHPFNGEGYARVALPNPPPEMADKLRQLYDGGITYLDAHLGTFLAELKRRGLYDSTMVVLTADHGEEFHEHGGWWHGTTLYDEQTHVPLLVKPARARGAHVVEDLVTSLDIAPSILAAATVTIPDVMQGHPLPLAAGVPTGRDSVFSEEDFEGNVLSAVRTRDWKFMTANADNPRGLPREALFDIGKDPQELANVAPQTPAQLETMRAAQGRSVLEARAHAGANQSRDVDGVTQDRLKALGYVN